MKKENITAITKQDIENYLEKAERTKSGAIKDNLLRLMDVTTKANGELKNQLALMTQMNSVLAAENARLQGEVARLLEVTSRRNFKVIK